MVLFARLKDWLLGLPEAPAGDTPMASGQLVLIDPLAIRTDPASYQFRSNGDTNGVTAQRRFDANNWDSNGDPLLVHQRLNGDYYVADGHHRLDLVKRLNAMGSGPGRVSAIVMREADGYSVEDVKIIAAYKNMQRDLSHGNHGPAELVDGAHVFKETRNNHPEWLPSLQMDKSDLHVCYDLSALSEQSLGAVAHGQVDARAAAAIAVAVPDTAQQDAVIRAIGNSKGAYDVTVSAQGRQIATGSFVPGVAGGEPAQQTSPLPEPLVFPKVERKWQNYLARRQVEVLAR